MGVQCRNLVERGAHHLDGQVVGPHADSDPFMARPIGERAVETMTASGMTAPGMDKTW